jgi:hypothetical protein
MGKTFGLAEEPAFERDLLRKVEMTEMFRRKGWRKNALQSDIGQGKSEEQAHSQRRQPATSTEPDSETQQREPAQPKWQEDKPPPCGAHLPEEVSNGESDKERTAKRSQKRVKREK